METKSTTMKTKGGEFLIKETHAKIFLFLNNGRRTTDDRSNLRRFSCTGSMA